MSWLKKKMFAYQLKNVVVRKTSQKSQQVHNLTSHIGILFDESHIDSMKEMEAIIKKWQNSGKHVETFSFIDQKEFTEEEDNPDNKICRKNINWYGMPKGEKVNTFSSKKFDILITINPEKKWHLHFLNAASMAKFKIGLLPDELEFYNLMIDCAKPDSIKKIFSDIQLTLDKLAG